MSFKTNKLMMYFLITLLKINKKSAQQCEVEGNVCPIERLLKIPRYPCLNFDHFVTIIPFHNRAAVFLSNDP